MRRPPKLAQSVDRQRYPTCLGGYMVLDEMFETRPVPTFGSVCAVCSKNQFKNELTAVVSGMHPLPPRDLLMETSSLVQVSI